MMSHQHTQECQQLQQLANNIPDLNALFDKDKNRANDFTINFDDLFFDYSKQLMTLEVKACLIELAEKKIYPVIFSVFLQAIKSMSQKVERRCIRHCGYL